MMNFGKSLVVAAFGLGLLVQPAVSGDVSPVGTWQQSTGETRVNVTMCGDGTQLCAQLTWLSEEARTAENAAHLNTLVVSGAKPVADNTWKGKVQFAGQSATGKIELVSPNTIKLSGCKLICKTFNFQRI